VAVVLKKLPDPLVAVPAVKINCAPVAVRVRVPLFNNLITSVAPLFPVWNIISAPVVPIPEVDLRIRVEVVVVPPIRSGAVIEVVIVGVTIVGEVANTSKPVPVSSEITPASSAEVVAENTDNLFDVYVTVPPVPNATDDVSVPVKVKVLLTVNVLPSARVKIEPVKGVVSVILLILVAEATPRIGVVSVGDVLNTILVEEVPVVPVALVR